MREQEGSVPVPQQMRSRARAAAAAAGAGAGWLAAVSAAPATCAPSRRSVRETWTTLIEQSCLTERTRGTRFALKNYRYSVLQLSSTQYMYTQMANVQRLERTG